MKYKEYADNTLDDMQFIPFQTFTSLGKSIKEAFVDKKSIVRKTIGDEEYDKYKFIADAINYMGYEVEDATTDPYTHQRNGWIINGALVYLANAFHKQSITIAHQCTELRKVNSVTVIIDSYSGYERTAYDMADRLGINIITMDDVFNAVYEEIMSNETYR